jgi:hypothetical protein
MRSLLFAAVAAAPVVAAAEPSAVDRVEILKFGSFVINNGADRIPDANAATGWRGTFNAYDQTAQTATICARLHETFGIEYIVHGSPDGAAVPVQTIVRFPPAGIVNDKGARFASHTEDVMETLGAKRGQFYSFDEPYELVPGPWVFEFHYQGRMIGSQAFAVRDCRAVS